MQFDVKTVNKILDIDDSFKAPVKLMQILYDKGRRERMFKEFLEISTDLSFDWFHEYFQDEQAERKSKKQDFTPQQVSQILVKLVASGSSYYEPTAGTGGITITKWWADCIKETPLTYMPHEHFYFCEELSDHAIPFLLFNLSIRGMNAIVWQGDVLERTCKGVFFVQNDKDDALSFSNINLMPYNDTVKREFDISEWTEDKYPPLWNLTKVNGKKQ